MGEIKGIPKKYKAYIYWGLAILGACASIATIYSSCKHEISPHQSISITNSTPNQGFQGIANAPVTINPLHPSGFDDNLGRYIVRSIDSIQSKWKVKIRFVQVRPAESGVDAYGKQIADFIVLKYNIQVGQWTNSLCEQPGEYTNGLYFKYPINNDITRINLFVKKRP